MKTFGNFLIFLLIVVLAGVESCQPKKDDALVPPNPTSQKFNKKFYTIKVTVKSFDLAVVMIDSATNETILTYGTKNSDGTLKAIRQIIDYTSDGYIVITNFSTTTYLPTDVTFKNKNTSITVKYISLDTQNRLVKCDIINNNTGITLATNKEIALNEKAVNGIKNAQNIQQTSFKSARRIDLMCEATKLIHKIIQYQSCIESIVLTTVLAINPLTAELALYPAYITVLTCQDVVEELLYPEKQKGECDNYDDDEVQKNGGDTIVECLGAIAKVVLGDKSASKECYKKAYEFFLDWVNNKRDPNKNPNNKPGGSSTGDPHILTADGYYYSFQGYGEFTCIKSTVDNFEIQVRQEDINNTKSATMNTAIGIQTGTDVVSAIAKPFGIYVNGQIQSLSSLPISLKNGTSISKIVENGRDTYTITTTNKDVIKFYIGGSNSLDYSLYLNSNRKGKVIGLLGNFDGDRTNDLQTRDGKVIEYSFDNLYPTFTDSWRISAQPNYARLLYYESGKDTESYTKRGFPASPTALAAQKLKDAETACRNAGVTSEPYLSNCIFDVAVTNDQSFAKSALWNQQANPATGIPYGSDIDEIKNIRVTVSNDPAIRNDSCLLSLSTGKVFRVKDGAQHASEIDILFLYGGYNDELYAHKPALAANLALQGPLLHRELLSQKWSVYKNTALESQAFVRDDNPSADNRVDAALWDYIKTTIDLKNSFYSDPSLLQNRDRFDETAIISGDATNPSILMKKTLRRFVTQDGKLGVIRFTNWGKTAAGWWLTMDIKVQK